jgi:hypothetical protein
MLRERILAGTRRRSEWAPTDVSNASSQMGLPCRLDTAIGAERLLPGRFPPVLGLLATLFQLTTVAPVLGLLATLFQLTTVALASIVMSLLKVGQHVTPTIRLVRHLGQGAMGTVWVAEHLTLELLEQNVRAVHATKPREQP